MAARLVDNSAYVLLGMAVALDQLLVALGCLSCVRIWARKSSDRRELSSGRLVDLAAQRGNGMQPRPLRRPPATLAGNDLEALAVAVRAQQDRLQHSALGDRIG